MKRCLVLAVALSLCAAPVSAGQSGAVTTSASAVDPVDELQTRNDLSMRLSVPVMVGTRGPYQFVVDTGADRSVITRELATQLRLDAGEPAILHSMSGAGSVDTVRIPSLGIAGRKTAPIIAPALPAQYLGASGLLGLDTLKGRRIVMDFAHHRLSIMASGEHEASDPDTIVVTARSRYGQLVLVDADVDRTPITVIIDTGAQNTIGNGALRRLLAKRNRKLDFFKSELIDVTGGRLPADIAAVGRIRIAGLIMENVVVAFADAHPFQRFGLTDRPAMLLGMDTLRGFRRVSVDFAQKKVRFLLPGQS